MKVYRTIVLAAAANLGGCALVFGPTPQNASDFRHLVEKNGAGVTQDTYQVNAPFAKVADRVRKKSAECLAQTLTECRGSKCDGTQYTFNPRFSNRRNSAELTVQVKVSDGVTFNGAPPKGGLFVAVADLTRKGPEKTQVAMYGLSMGMYKYIPKAVKHWADGSNLGCPNFAAGF